MPLTEMQSRILGVIAANRNPENYVAGGTVLNADGVRFSRDIDLFSDREEGLDRVSDLDCATIRRAGMDVEWTRRLQTFRSAVIRSGNDATRLDWAVDSDYRFFPTQPDPVFGYRLHPVDMATNKLMASVNRRETRDILDLAVIFDGILPAGPLAWAAAEKSPGYSPDMILHQLKRHAAVRQSDLDEQRPCAVTDAGYLNSLIRQECDSGQDWIDSVPGDFGFGLFVDARNRPCCPDFAMGAAEGVRIHAGARKGFWPTSPDISASMLEAIREGSGCRPGI